jgi:hydroxyacylglutathione hydrolase
MVDINVKYEIQTFPVGAFQCNCSVLSAMGLPGTIVVDPGDDAELVQSRVQHLQKPLTLLWHTHAHLDHVGATKSLFEWATKWNGDKGFPAPQIFLHEEDRWLYENIKLQSGALGLPSFEVVRDFSRIKDAQTYEGFPSLKALFTPGHTPGSCCLLADSFTGFEIQNSYKKSTIENDAAFLFSGDTLFRRSIGRTDLWGGDGKRIIQSIEKKLMPLSPNTVVIPGHGPITTIGEEKEMNPFLEL